MFARKTLNALSFTAIAALALATVPALPAATQQGPAETARTEAPADAEPSTFTDRQIRGFVIASLRLDRLIADAENSRDPDEFQKQARKVVSETSGIDHALYQRIARAVWHSEPLRTRVRQVMAKLRRQEQIAGMSADGL